MVLVLPFKAVPRLVRMRLAREVACLIQILQDSRVRFNIHNIIAIILNKSQ